jgi:phosphoglycerol transferase MdoB-like AlkP superfamily enzyme
MAHVESHGHKPACIATIRPVWLRLGRYATIAEVVVILILAFTALRLTLLLLFAEAMPSLGAAVRIFWIGFRFDLLVALLFVLPQTLRMTLFGEWATGNRIGRAWTQAEWLIGFVLLPFLLATELVFFDEFGSRLNYIAFEYLVYPGEVCCNLYQSYPLTTWLSVVAAIGGGLFFGLRRRFLARLSIPAPARLRYSILGGVLATTAGLWLTTETADTDITGDRIANECAGNGLYSFGYYALTCRFDYESFYLTIDSHDAGRRVRDRLATSRAEFVPLASHPLERTVASPRPREDRNVVLILEESFGSDFVGSLGDPRGLTPNFDALAAKGLLFDNFYATGNRTARALEATLTGLPPIPTESILKRDHSSHVCTLANVLAERGYERLFVTGGRGVFDGVKSFMTTNGFNHFVEESDFVEPVFSNAWGVSDEDLFHRAIEELDALHASGKPFFATLLTVSNHRPFTYPPGRISGGKQTRDDAVRYADYALGDFFRRAKEHPFYKDTIFVVMGDHGARIYGSQMFPMRSYRVPVVVVLPEAERAGTRCSTLACSLDIAPTIMGLLGGEYRGVFFGRDALAINPADGYALMQHNHDLALLDAKGNMAVLGANRSANCYRYDKTTFGLKAMGLSNPELVADCAAFFQTADELYYAERLYPAGDIATTPAGMADGDERPLSTASRPISVRPN